MGKVLTAPFTTQSQKTHNRPTPGGPYVQCAYQRAANGLSYIEEPNDDELPIFKCNNGVIRDIVLDIRRVKESDIKQHDLYRSYDEHASTICIVRGYLCNNYEMILHESRNPTLVCLESGNWDLAHVEAALSQPGMPLSIECDPCKIVFYITHINWATGSMPAQRRLTFKLMKHHIMMTTGINVSLIVTVPRWTGSSNDEMTYLTCPEGTYERVITGCFVPEHSEHIISTIQSNLVAFIEAEPDDQLISEEFVVPAAYPEEFRNRAEIEWLKSCNFVEAGESCVFYQRD